MAISRENGAERIDTALVKVDFSHSELLDTDRKCNGGALIRHKFQNCAQRQSEVMASLKQGGKSTVAISRKKMELNRFALL